MFRGTLVSSGFLEGPDPRLIERSLENVISDALRKQLQSDGQMKELSLHLYQLLSQVQDGATELEAQRHQIETAESDLKARTALSDGVQAPAVVAAQQRLLDAWSQFDQTMADTKTGFIGLVTELEALGQTSAASCGRTRIRRRRWPRPPRAWTRDLSWSTIGPQRMADPPSPRAGRAAGPGGSRGAAEARARTSPRRTSIVRRSRTATRCVPRISRVWRRWTCSRATTPEGKRLLLRDQIDRELARFGALDANTGPAGDILGFIRADVDKSAAAGTADREQKRAVAEELRRTFIGAMKPSLAAGAAFDRLERLEKTLDDKREALLAGYLSKAGDDPKNFILTDLELDDYLKAQSALDAELAKTLESPEFAPDTGMARLLDGLYDVNASLDRAVDQSKSGRGMAALDALIMLEQTRLRAAAGAAGRRRRSTGSPRRCRACGDMKAGWADRTKDAGLDPVYALTVVGATGERTWNAKKWLTLTEVSGTIGTRRRTRRRSSSTSWRPSSIP